MFVEGGATSPSSPQDNSKMPLMDLLTSEVPKQYSPGGNMAGQDPMARQRSAEVVFSRQVRLKACLHIVSSHSMPQTVIKGPAGASLPRAV